MARLSVIICDLCKKLSQSAGNKLQLFSGKKLDVKGEICQKCFDDIKAKFSAEVNLETLNQPTARKVHDGAIVPSTADNVAASPRRATTGCVHKNTKFQSPFIICEDCGAREST